MAYRQLGEADQVALDAALTGAALFRRDDLVGVVATGKHRGRFLHALTTQHVNDVPDWTASENTLCNAQGRLLATAHMVVEADRIVLWTDKGLADSMIETLLSYRVAERVRLEVDENLCLLELVGPGATTMLAEQQAPTPTARTVATWTTEDTEVRCWQRTTGGRAGAPHGEGVPAWNLAVPRTEGDRVATQLLAAGASEGSEAARDALRILAGEPRIGVDIDDGTQPAEAGLGAAVSLDKGCYLGQEAIAMLAYRGQLRRHLCWLEPAGDNAPPPGARLRTDAGRRAGLTGTGFTDRGGRSLGLGTIARKAYQPGAVLQTEAPDGTLSMRVLSTTEIGAWQG